MKRDTLWLLAAMQLTFLVNVNTQQPDVPLQYDCRRYGQSCADIDNNPCDPDTGVCTCEDDKGGSACEIDVDPDAGDCGPDCAGTCISGTCVCGPGSFGSQCQLERLSISCEPEEMTIRVAPVFGQLPYEGRLLVLGKEDKDQCVFDKNDLKDTEEGMYFEEKINFDDCGGNLEEVNEEGNTRVFFDFYLTYHPDLIVRVDYFFSASCIFQGLDKDFPLDSEILTFNRSTAHRETGRVDEDFQSVKLKVYNNGGSEITKPVIIGDPVTLVFEGVQRFEVISITAADGTEDGETYNLVENGEDQMLTAVPLDIQCDDNKVTIELEAFKLQGSNVVIFQTKLKLCADDECPRKICGEEPPTTDGEENAENANGNGNGNGNGDGNGDGNGNPNDQARRRRRDLETPEEYQELDASILIEFPQRAEPVSAEKPCEAPVKQPACGHSIPLLAMVGALAVLLVIATAICMSFFIRMRTAPLKSVGCIHHTRKDDLGNINYDNFRT